MSKNKNWFIESTVEAGEVIINDGGSAVDFRIEGDTDPNLLVTDGSADKVGIGTKTPGTKLDVTSDSVGELIAAVNHNVSSIMPAEIVMKKGRGSRAYPATITDGDELGQISFQGYDGGNYDELAHIKVKSLSVSSDTSSMTLHSDKFIFDTGTLQFGTTGNFSAAVKGVHPSGVTLDGNSSDDYLITAKALYDNLNFASLSGISWASAGSYVDSIPRLDTASTLTASNIYSNGASGNVSIGADTTDEQSEKFKLTGTSAFIGALTVGVDDTGHDVKLFGATAGKYMLWDESADTLQLGASGGSAGVDFIAYGNSSGRYLEWDESQNKLFVAGDVTLGWGSGNTITMKGTIKPSAFNSSIEIDAFSTQTADVFIVNDKNSAKAFFVEDDGIVKVNTYLKFANPTGKSIEAGALSLGDSGSVAVIDYDTGYAGGKAFALQEGGVSRLSFDASDNFNLNATTFETKTTGTSKFKATKLIVNGVGDSASSGILEVSEVKTSTGNLVLDSSGGTVHVKDNLTVDGTINVSGIDVSGTTSDTFMIDSDGKDIGFKTEDIADSSLPIAVSKWVHPIADAAGAIGSAGIATQYIHSDNTMTISTKDDTDFLILAPGYNHDAGKVLIGTSTSKEADLLCYGSADIRGNLTVTGTVSGSFGIDATTSATFQLDSGGDGPHFVVGSDDLIQTTASDESTLKSIHTAGILLDNVAGGSNILTLQSYNQEIQLIPGSNDAGERYVGITGSINVAQGGATTYNYISGAGTKIGAAAHSSFAGTSDMSTGDTSIYMANGSFNFDASEDIANISGADLVFGATNLSGAGATDNKEVKFYGNSTSAYMQWNQSANKFLTVGTAVGTTNFQIHTGKAVFGRTGVDSLDVEFFGAAGEIATVDAGDSFLKVSQGFRKVPEVKSSTVSLTTQESGRAIAVKNKTADAVYTLPNAEDGLNYKFMIVEKDGAYDVEIKSAGATEFFHGGVTHLDTDNETIATVVSDNDSNDFLTLTLVEAGSMVEMYCDGTNWFVTGHVASTTAPAFGDASGL